MLIAGNALLMAVGFVITCGRRCPASAVMTSVIFSIVKATAAYAWIVGVACADKLVEGGLSLFVKVAEGLKC